MYTEIDQCRICGNTHLELLFDLGEQALAGIFPTDSTKHVSTMPVQLVKCMGDDCCGLVQMKHSGAPEEMYGMNYGYRSGLNRSMVEHLHGLYERITDIAKPQQGDIVLDIGSNDATLLKNYDASALTLVGMDPTGTKFRQYYPDTIRLIPDFFSAANFESAFPEQKAKIITSIAMFYDLEDPQAFVNDIASVLVDDGVWMFEQSYLPLMLTTNAYDTICQEHLEYYAMRQIVWLLKRADMTVLDAYETDANGGSICVIAAKNTHPSAANSTAATAFLQKEQEAALNTLAPYQAFRKRVEQNRDDLVALLQELQSNGKTVFGLGASTKGNVVLQYCGITEDVLPFVAEVNEDKFGCFTPGTRIPIISQHDADRKKPDYYLVLPWHFRKNITQNMNDYIHSGGKLIFPLPELTIVGD